MPDLVLTFLSARDFLRSSFSFLVHRAWYIELPVLGWARNWIIGQYRHPVFFLSPGAGSGQS
jgi:hypothetical protein